MYMQTEMATPREARDFHHEAMKELDNLIVGEERAKLALLTGMVMGRNVVLLGGTGSGKTEMAHEGWRLIEDLPEKDVVYLDTKDDLQPKEVTGAEIPTRNTINGVQEMIIVEGMLKPSSKILIANEINRTSPSALNTILEVFEKREMQISGRKVSLAQLQYAVATMNPGEHKQNVHTLSQANASRFELGAVVGEDPESNRKRSEAIHLQGFEPQQPKGVISIAGLEAVRRFAKSGVGYSEEAGRRAIDLVAKTGTAFATQGVNEKGGRLDVHVKQTAMAITALRGEETTKPEHVEQAVRFIVAAVIGMTTTKGMVQVEKTAQEIL